MAKAAAKKLRPDDELLRKRVEKILSDQNPWRGYEAELEWLERLLRRPADYEFTPNQHAAVIRIKVARTPFEGWDGFSVQELARGAKAYAADFGYEDDEVFVDDILARNVTSLSWSDMRRLLGLCRIAGMDIARFNPPIDAFDDAA